MSKSTTLVKLPPEFSDPRSRVEVDLLRSPDPEPGWATRHPDWALAFLYLSPRPCTALEELMKL